MASKSLQTKECRYSPDGKAVRVHSKDFKKNRKKYFALSERTVVIVHDSHGPVMTIGYLKLPENELPAEA